MRVEHLYFLESGEIAGIEGEDLIDSVHIHRSDEARVEGRFVTTTDGEETEMVLARVLPLDGRSRAYVNGRLATASTLSELGASLLELHGQHAHQSLLTTPAQRSAVDRFGKIDLSAATAASVSSALIVMMERRAGSERRSIDGGPDSADDLRDFLCGSRRDCASQHHRQHRADCPGDGHAEERCAQR